jgi:nucleoside-diphosphate-sugar epimerase
MEDFAAVERLMATIRPEVVFHLSGLSNGAPNLDLLLPTFHSQLTSAVNVLTSATRLGCRRVILIGSLEEPGDAAGLEHQVPTSPYGAAKWAAAVYARMCHRLYGTPVAIVRIYMMYGPGQRREKVIPYTIESLLAGEIPQLSSGTRALDWVYVDDAVEGLVLAACADGLDGETVDLGAGVAVPIRAVADQLVQLINPRLHAAFGALPDRPADQVHVADTAKTESLLGWRSRTSLREGLERTVASQRASQSTSRPPARAAGGPPAFRQRHV